MAPKSKTVTKTRDPAMGIFVDYMRSRGPTPVPQVVKEVTQTEELRTGQLEACLGFMTSDDRFIVTGQGVDAVCVLVDAERAEVPGGKEPEELTVESATVSAESIVNNSPAEITEERQTTIPYSIEVPVVAPEANVLITNADPTPTIGEQLAVSEAAKAVEPPANDSQPYAQASEPTAHDRELDERFNTLRALTEELGTFEDEFARLTKARGEAKKAVDFTRAKMIEVINGKSMEEIEDLPVFKLAKETKPAPVSPTLQTIAANTATAEVATEKPTGFNFWDMGVAAAKDPTQEWNCPISRERDAAGVPYWFAGFRNELAADKDSHEAQVQALFHDQLLKAALPDNGLLPKGVEQPKVQVVKWNERCHLVLDMVTMEGTEGSWNDWYLLPLVDRDEWATLYEKEFGHAVKGAHENPEKEADRLKGGVDTGRLVKAGCNVLVCSPRRMVAIVYTVIQKEA